MESTFSKIIIVVLAIVVLMVGGFSAWYFLQPPASSQPVQTTPVTTYNSDGTSNTVQTTPSQKPATPNITDAYTVLFTKLSAHQVTYSTVNASSGGTVVPLYALYTKDEAVYKQLYPGTVFTLDVAAVDLNGDGVAEALVYEDSNGFCGVGGCNLDIYQDQKNSWVKIGSALVGSAVGVSSKSTGGYVDLYLSVSDGTSTKVVRYAWNGASYQPQETTAAWDGATFYVVK